MSDRGKYLWLVAPCVAIAYFVFFYGGRATRPGKPWPVGYQELVSAGCVYTQSLDGKKELDLLENQRAVLYDKATKDARGQYPTFDGSWTLTVDSQYAVTLGGALTAYLLIVPEHMQSCILVKGSRGTADLSASWFGGVIDEDPRERERDTPGL
jgi:hypothetical protein